jgi:hypothetical protein
MLNGGGAEKLMSRRNLATDISQLGPHSTSLQQAKILERSNSLRRKIDAWMDIQHLYFPFIAVWRSRADQQGGGKPVSVQSFDLYLPSSFVRQHVIRKNFLETEWCLRFAHAEEALNDLRSLLLMRSMMWNSKERHMRGQQQQTRSQTLLEGVGRQIGAAAEKYRRIREALVALAAPLHETSWEKVFLPLEKSDIVGLTSLDETNQSEGRKKLTWIWKVQGMDISNDKKIHSSLFISSESGIADDTKAILALELEWCRACACAHRWQEECLLLNEEMRQVSTFFKWQAADWRWKARELENKPLISTSENPVIASANVESQRAVRDGKIAYAY